MGIQRTTLLKAPADNTQEIAAFDVEGTLTEGATWAGLRTYLEANGQGDLFKRFLRRKMLGIMLFRLHLIRDERAFKEQWVLDELRLFAGYSEAQLAEVGQFVVERELWPKRRPSIVNEIEKQKQDGRRVLLVTGVMEPVLAVLADKLGVEAIGTPLQYKNGDFTGEVAAPINTGIRKVEQLEPFARDGKIYAAYGDTAADIPMLQMAQNPVAVFPDKQLSKTAQANNWRILA
ncbi:MAG TPA: hypothetical protein EYP41_17985 [Anaerolineae bacterium]|nr:hypothetical protein [Anaerolineae bacterium]